MYFKFVTKFATPKKKHRREYKVTYVYKYVCII